MGRCRAALLVIFGTGGTERLRRNGVDLVAVCSCCCPGPNHCTPLARNQLHSSPQLLHGAQLVEGIALPNLWVQQQGPGITE